MPMERLSMRKIKEVLRLKYECQLSNVKIASSCQISREAVRKYLLRANKAQLNWPLPLDLDDEAIERLLFPSEFIDKKKPQPNWSDVHNELKKKGVTLWLLWDEYRAGREGDGLGYSRFCFLYRDYQSNIDIPMRQTHKAGEKLFIDYAGLTVPWTDQTTGEVHQAEIFVTTLGASNYTYVEAMRTQSLPDWINGHIHAFEFMGGVTEILVPDNLKSGVSKAHIYEPDINPTYQDMANHYGVAIIPARVRKPQDKAKVETGVKHVEQRILAPLRHRTFFSIAEINQAIRELLESYNKKPFQQMPGSRHSQFMELEKAYLRPLPNYRYDYAEWKKVKAGIDYHIAFDNHYYSVPFRYRKLELHLKITRTILECFYKGQSIAVHKRSYGKGHTTTKEHMPKKHQAYIEWTPERIIHWAKSHGEHTATLIKIMIESRPHPQQAFRACLGILRLGRHYGKSRIENAAKRAVAIGSCSYKSMESILKHRLDEKPLNPPKDSYASKIIPHENIRGGDYYHS